MMTLTGADGRATRHVMVDGVEIGRVEPRNCRIGSLVHPVWHAVALDGTEHGSWMSSWLAAQALVRAAGLD